MDDFYRSLISHRLSMPQAEIITNNNNFMTSNNNATDSRNNCYREHTREMSDVLAARSALAPAQQSTKQSSPVTFKVPPNDNRNQLVPSNHHRRSESANNKPSFDQEILNHSIPVVDSTSNFMAIDISGQKVVGFNVGGEPRLCLPHLLSTVFKPVPLQQIYKACSDLHVYFSSATPSQLRVLFELRALRETTQTCGLITRTQTERLCNVLNPPPPTPAATCQFLTAYYAQTAAAAEQQSSSYQHIIPVRHRCFGRCRGRAFADLYTSDDAACIQCEQCDMLLTPRAFVLHSHKKKSEQNQTKSNLLQIVAGGVNSNSILAAALAGDVAAIEQQQQPLQPEVANTCHWGFDASKWRQYLHCYCRPNEQPSRRELLDAAWENFKQKFCTPSPSSSSPPIATTFTAEQLQKLERMQRTAGPGGGFALLPFASAETVGVTLGEAQVLPRAEIYTMPNGSAAADLPSSAKHPGQQSNGSTQSSPPHFSFVTNKCDNVNVTASMPSTSTQSAVPELPANDGEHQAAFSRHLKAGITEIMTCLAAQNRLTPELYQSLVNIVARPDLIPSSLIAQLTTQLGIDITNPSGNIPVIVTSAVEESAVITPEIDAAVAAAPARQEPTSSLPTDSGANQQQSVHQTCYVQQQSTTSAASTAESTLSTHDELIRKLSARLTDSLTQLEKLKLKLPAPVREVFSSAVSELNATYKDAFDRQAKHVDDLEMQLAAMKLPPTPSATTTASVSMPSADQIALLSRALAQRDEIIKSLNEQLSSTRGGGKLDAFATAETDAVVANSSLVVHLREMIAARDEKIAQLERQVELLENKLTSVLLTTNRNNNTAAVDAAVKPTDSASCARVGADENLLPSKFAKNAEKEGGKGESAVDAEILCCSKPEKPSRTLSPFSPPPTKVMSPPVSSAISFVPCVSALSRQKVRKLRGSMSTDLLTRNLCTSVDDLKTISACRRGSNDENDENNTVDLHQLPSRRNSVSVMNSGRIAALKQEVCDDVVDLREKRVDKPSSDDEQMHRGRRNSLHMLNDSKDPRTPPKRTFEECSNDDDVAEAVAVGVGHAGESRK